jgi:hypothetical protein
VNGCILVGVELVLALLACAVPHMQVVESPQPSSEEGCFFRMGGCCHYQGA